MSVSALEPRWSEWGVKHPGIETLFFPFFFLLSSHLSTVYYSCYTDTLLRQYKPSVIDRLSSCCCLSPTDDDDDKAKVIVGVVVGLIVAAALVGIIYWLYMRNRCSLQFISFFITFKSRQCRKRNDDEREKRPRNRTWRRSRLTLGDTVTGVKV